MTYVATHTKKAPIIGRVIKCPRCEGKGTVFLENYRYMFYCAHCSLHAPLKTLHQFRAHTLQLF